MEIHTKQPEQAKINISKRLIWNPDVWFCSLEITQRTLRRLKPQVRRLRPIQTSGLMVQTSENSLWLFFIICVHTFFSRLQNQTSGLGHQTSGHLVQATICLGQSGQNVSGAIGRATTTKDLCLATTRPYRLSETPLKA